MSIAVIKEHIEITRNLWGKTPYRRTSHPSSGYSCWHEQMGMSSDEILYHYPSITLSDIYAALAYYHDRQDEIRSAIEADAEFASQLKAQTPSLLQQKLKNRQHG